MEGDQGEGQDDEEHEMLMEHLSRFSDRPLTLKAQHATAREKYNKLTGATPFDEHLKAEDPLYLNGIHTLHAPHLHVLKAATSRKAFA